MKLSNKIAVVSVLVAIISVLITLMADKKENQNKVFELNNTSQTTYGNTSPNIINNEGNINVN